MAQITAIELNKSSLSLEVGASEALVITKTPEDGEGEITWTSSDDTVATVADGTVTAVKEGTATITASAGENITAECAVTVTAKSEEGGGDEPGGDDEGGEDGGEAEAEDPVKLHLGDGDTSYNEYYASVDYGLV